MLVRNKQVGVGARAATRGQGRGGNISGTSCGGLASRVLANQLALRLGAEGGLLAAPVAVGHLAHRLALRLRRNARNLAVRRVANSLTGRAVIGLANILGATNRADGRVALRLASGGGKSGALDLALRTLAHRVALSGASGIVTGPSALGVAGCLLCRGNRRQENNHDEG